MKILLISAYFPPDTGSAANLFCDLGKKLGQKGHSVTVLTSFPSYHVTGDVKCYKGKKFIREEIDGLKIIRVKVPQFPRYIPAMRAMWQFAMAHRFSHAVKKMDMHDIALIYSPPLPLGFTGASLTRKTGCPFILNVQDLFPQSAIDLKILKNGFLISFFEYLERKIYSYARHITVHSQGNRDHVVKRGVDREKVTIIPNWINTDYLQPGKEINSFACKYGLQNKFIVSFAGVIGYSQDVDVILDSADLLRTKKDVLFLIVGDGVEKGRLMKKAERMELDSVKFLPMQPREAYSQVLNTSNVCLSTLHKEVLTPVVPSKILSIMAAGKPLIACMNQSGDAPRLIKEAKCGFVLPAGDFRSLAEKVVCLYGSSRLCDEFGTNGLRYCHNNFSVDIGTEKYIGLFEQIVREG